MHRSRWAFILLLVLLAACAPQAAHIPSTPYRPADPANGVAETAQVATAQANAVSTLLNATASASTATAAARPTATITPTAAPTSSPTEKPTTSAPANQAARTRYHLTVDFDYDQRYGRVSEEIQYTNNARDPLPELLLTVEMKAYPSAVFEITGLWWLVDGQAVENAGWDGITVRFPLRQPLQPGQQVGLKLTYEFGLPSLSSLGGDRPMPIGYTNRQANLVDWYPFIPPYQTGKGWLAHPPSYYGEHLVYDLADFEVDLKVSSAPETLLVAASAEARIDGDWRRYQRQSARNFAISVGSDYQVETEKVGQITVNSYYFPANVKAGKQVLKTTVESLALYQTLFGPYPHDTLTVVEADFLDGMEYDGLYFLSRAFYNLYQGAPADYLIAIAAHETAHQWWYGIIANDQANQPWLDEALCTYTEKIFFERLHPDGLDWWWSYRIRAERPVGWVDSSVYSPPGQLQTYLNYRNAVYLNGAMFLEELRQLVGDEAFFAFLKDYATRYAGQIAFQSDFFATLKQHTDADYRPLLQKYFANPEMP